MNIIHACWAPATHTWHFCETGQDERELNLGVGVSTLASNDVSHPGPGWRFWAAASRWVYSLLARQRFQPTLSGGVPGWTAALDAPPDAAILARLADQLPPCALRGECLPSARTLLREFATAAVSSLARGWLREEPVSVPRLGCWPVAERAWMQSLLAGDVKVSSGSAAVARLERELQAQRRASPLPGLTLCADEGLWLEVDWPGEVELADLGRAVGLYPPLERYDHPQPLALEPEEVCELLRSAAWVLQEAGYTVRLPGDLGQRSSPRARLSADESLESFGLEALLSYRWTVALGDQQLSLEEFRELVARQQPLVRSRGRWVAFDHAGAARLLRVLEEKVSLGRALALAGGLEAEDLPLEVEFQGDLKALAEGGPLLGVPPDLQATLRPYQERGFSWLAWLAERGLGACLADDMGLGKTIQLLTLLLHVKGGCSLLVCPTSVVGNWQREAERFAPGLRVWLHHGPRRLAGEEFAHTLAEHDLIVTSYALAWRDAELLQAQAWNAVVLDEAQNIKNPDAQQTRAIGRLSARIRVALTGTPVENRLMELWSIMAFLNPGLLGPRTRFQRETATPIERHGRRDKLERLRGAVGPFLLRRLKSDPAIAPDLPAKQESKLYCALTSEQATLYQAVVDDLLERLRAAQGFEREGLILKMLLRLKQLCNHPALFLGDGSALPARSGKLLRLEEMLEECRNAGEAALVFSQFAGFARQLAAYLGARLGHAVPCLHGSLEREAREAMVDSFQSPQGPPVMVLSLKAGGVGLNLTRASHVFHFDRWWNPAVENQATDRAYRIGQGRTVFVYKLICQGTLEESIDRLIERKSALAEQVLGGGSEAWLGRLDNQALGDLVRLTSASLVDG